MTLPDRDADELAHEREQKLLVLRRREEEARAQTLAKKLSLSYRDLKTAPIDGMALTMRPLQEQRGAQAALLRRDDHQIFVASFDPSHPAFVTFVSALEQIGLRVTPIVVSQTSLEYAWSLYLHFSYLQTQTTGEIALNPEALERLQKEILGIPNLTQRLLRIAPNDIAILVELLLAGALRLDASDIHIEPLEETNAKLRYRLDGVLHDLVEIRSDVYRLLGERIKLLAGLKLNVTNRGQDGRFTVRAQKKDLEVRVSTLPGRRGEFLVLRLLNPENLLDIPQLGLRPDLLRLIEEELKRPNGMILTTGPTGSGKTTLLYAFLRKVVTPEVKAITIEDPIEYRIAGVEQTQTNADAGYTFSTGLRSIVRQDPDIILVGEIRDHETAAIAINAALTGHLVFSTLHTNDAAGALPRLLDLKINTAVLGPALNAVVAQRLLRRVCLECAKASSPDKTIRSTIERILANVPKEIFPSDRRSFTLQKVSGCSKCHNTGYRGRIGIFEIFLINEDAERFTMKKPSSAQVREFAIQQGMITLQQDALMRAIEGVTTIEEIIRITGPLALPHKAEVPMEPSGSGS